MRSLLAAGIVCCLTLLMSSNAQGYDVIVTKEKKTFSDFTTINGATIKSVQVGYETYGKLSHEKDNVILLCHGSQSFSHFAGKYALSDPKSGIWDHVIGPGNIIDTDKYYVIASDSLSNFWALHPFVHTTGPASIDPTTNKHYGMAFPIVTIADFVELQKKLLNSLNIHKLYAVMGFSMGGMQTLEWASRYPDMVARAIPVVGQAEQGAYNIELKDIVQSIIKLDPNWNGGDYYGPGRKPPTEGLAVALKAMYMTETSYGPIDRKYDRRWADPQKNPALSWNNKFAVQADYDKLVREEEIIKYADANSWIYIAQALNLFQTGHGSSLRGGLAKITAKVLFIPSRSDQLIFPEFSRQAYALMKAMGKDVDIFELPGDGGHNEFENIDQAEVKLRAFLK